MCYPGIISIAIGKEEKGTFVDGETQQREKEGFGKEMGQEKEMGETKLRNILERLRA